jgi:hypothetical protein
VTSNWIVSPTLRSLALPVVDVKNVFVRVDAELTSGSAITSANAHSAIDFFIAD